MYIKAKYPKVGNEFGGPNAGPQGFGSLYGGNQVSDITRTERNETLITENESQFPK
jgi:hypothetical protein